MTILTIIGNVCEETGWTSAPAAVIGSTDRTVLALLRQAYNVGRELRRAYPWPVLRKEGTVTLATSTANYALADDFHYFHNNTIFNRSTDLELDGPLSAQDWQMQQLASGSGLSQNWRVMGAGNGKFYIDPTPTSSENGQTVYFEYQTKNWIRPQTWAAGQTYSAAQYCWYNGVIYSTASGGTTVAGGTAGPTGDTGVTDWTAYTGAFETFNRDTDTVLLEEWMIEAGLKAFWKKEKRFEGWEDDLADFWGIVGVEFGMSIGSSVTTITGGKVRQWPNVPQTGINGYVGP